MHAGTYHCGPARELLPLLGQIASPLQSHWMITQMLFSTHPQAEQMINDLHEKEVNFLIHSHLSQWPLPVMSLPREITLRFDDEAPIHFKAQQAFTVRELSQHIQKMRMESGSLRFLGQFKMYQEHEYIPFYETQLMALKFGTGPFDLESDLTSLGKMPPGLHELTMQREGMKLLAKADKSHFCFLSPLMMEQVETLHITHALQFLQEQIGDCTDITCFYWDHGHWVFLHAQKRGDCLDCSVYDGLVREAATGLEYVVDRIRQALSLCQVHIVSCRNSFSPRAIIVAQWLCFTWAWYFSFGTTSMMVRLVCGTLLSIPDNFVLARVDLVTKQ